MHKLFDMDKNEDGFTLVEILVVIGIIGILAAIAIPVFLNQRKTSVDASIQSDARNVVMAVQTYISDNEGKVVPITATVIRPYLGNISKGSVIALSGNSNDWCVLGRNVNGNLNSWDVANKYVYWNSVNGGWQNPATMWYPTSCATTTSNNAGWSFIYGPN